MIFEKCLLFICISLVSLALQFAAYQYVWSHFFNPAPPKKIKYTIIIAFITLSLIIGCLAIHDDNKPLEAVMKYYSNSSPSYVVHNSIAYEAHYEAPNYVIIINNPNNSDAIIKSIDLIIDEFVEINAIQYDIDLDETDFDLDYPAVYYSKVKKNDKNDRLYFWGIGNPKGLLYTEKQKPVGYLKLQANNQKEIIPYSPFAKSGKYTIHYVINYFLDGQSMQIGLPQKTFFITHKDYECYHIRKDDLNKLYGITVDDFNQSKEKMAPLDKKVLNQLTVIRSNYSYYFQERIYPLIHPNIK